MKQLLIALTLLTLTSSSAYPLVFYKVSPDYEISASMNVVVIDRDPLTIKWHVNIKVRDMLLKENLKAWDKTTADPADFDRSGLRELSAFSKEYGNYDLAYKLMIESVFKIAMQIQDAGLIPVIKYGNIDQIDSTGGTMFHDKTVQPDGAWSSKRRWVLIKTFYTDYYVLSSISPVMSEDKLSVLSWITSFKIQKNLGNERSVWAASETNLLNFDLTAPDTNTKSTFIIQSATWLDAQKAMFVQSHLLISKMIRSQPDILIEVRYGDINFVSSSNVKLIDLTNGILPDGNMIAYVSTLPAMTETIAPLNNSTINTSPVTFSWQPAVGATSYKLEYWEDNKTHQFVTTQNTSAQVTLAITSTMKWYNWKVVGINDEGEGAAWGTDSFTTQQ